MKHTPGPWQLREGKGDNYWIGTGLPYSENTIATVYYDQANAKLIAAAPDLLAALENLVMSDLSGGTIVQDEEGDRYKEVQAAIAKATE